MIRFGIVYEDTFEYLYKRLSEIYYEERPQGSTLRELQQLLNKHKFSLLNPLQYNVNNVYKLFLTSKASKSK
jgi:hypothetical protein